MGQLDTVGERVTASIEAIIRSLLEAVLFWGQLWGYMEAD